MKKRPLWIKVVGQLTWLMAAGFLMTACTEGYDDDAAFESLVKNSTLATVNPDDIVYSASADGGTFTFQWPVVHGAGGYALTLLDVGNPEHPDTIATRVVDGCSTTTPREDDVNYMLLFRVLDNAALGNTAPKEISKKEFTTFTPTYASIPAVDETGQPTDLTKWFAENPIPADSMGVSLNFDLQAGANYIISGDIDFGGQQVGFRSTSKNDFANLSVAQNAKFITWAGFSLKYLNIDCSQTNKPIIELSAEPGDTIKNLVGTGNYYFIEQPINIQSCNISKLGACLIQDQGKYVVRTLAINDCIIEIDRTAEATNAVNTDQIIKLTKSSYVTDFLVKNSTIYSHEHTTSAFLQYNGRPKELNVGNAELQKISFVNSTLVNLSYGSNFRGDTRTQGQVTNYFTVERCIIVDCGKKNFCNALLRQMSTAPTVSYYRNTYWWNGENVKEAQTGDGADNTGTALDTDPDFTDPENGDFTPRGADQLYYQTGDPRWYATK